MLNECGRIRFSYHQRSCTHYGYYFFRKGKYKKAAKGLTGGMAFPHHHRLAIRELIYPAIFSGNMLARPAPLRP